MSNTKQYNKQYYIDHKEKREEQCKQWRKDNLEKVRKINEQWQKNNLEKVRKCCKQWRKNNPQYFKNRYRTNLRFNLNWKVSREIEKELKSNRHWETLVDYTINDLIKRLLKTMPSGYDWDDFLRGELHIDHIIPISAFNFNKPEDYDFQRCWALGNLRLLPAKENFKKYNKLIKPFQSSLTM